MGNVRVVIGVYNISGYLMAGVRKLLAFADVLLVQSPVYEVLEGGYEDLKDRCQWIDCDPSKKDHAITQRVVDWEPDVFLCSGWTFPLFLQIARKVHQQGCSNVLMSDTSWRGDLRQWIHTALTPFYLLPYFDYGWGFGKGQLENFRHLGFRKDQRIKGCYSIDTDRFLKMSMLDRDPWPHKFLYIGRYAEEKNLPRMFRAFLRAIELMENSDWELICIGGGGGPIWEQRVIHPKIHHLGYCPPAKMTEIMPPVGCFVLPSIRESWGLVVQECAVMGLPLLCSTEVHATEDYLVNGENGFLFDPYDEEELCQKFVRIMSMSDEDLRAMGKKSQKLGLSYTTEDWANQIREFAKK